MSAAAVPTGFNCAIMDRVVHFLSTTPGEGSISNPAESANQGMLAVGATHYWDTHTIAEYSSQVVPRPTAGSSPTSSVRPAARQRRTSHYLAEFYGANSCWFAGTSQAAPHVAGMAALVRQRFPRLCATEQTGSIPERQRSSSEETPDPQQHLGARFRPIAVFPGPGNALKEAERAALVALYNAAGGRKLDEQRQLGERPARWPVARRDHRPQWPGCWTVPPREWIDRRDTV